MTCRVILFLLLTATVSAAHSWYPFECCSGYDCHPIECHELTTLDDQRVLYSPGPKTVIEFPPTAVRPSPDGHCHVCFEPTHSTPYCVFIRTSS